MRRLQRPKMSRLPMSHRGHSLAKAGGQSCIVAPRAGSYRCVARACGPRAPDPRFAQVHCQCNRPPHAGPRRSSHLFGHGLQCLDVQRLVDHHLLQPVILVFDLEWRLRLAHVHAAMLCLTAIDCRLANSRRDADLVERTPRLHILGSDPLPRSIAFRSPWSRDGLPRKARTPFRCGFSPRSRLPAIGPSTCKAPH